MEAEYIGGKYCILNVNCVVERRMGLICNQYIEAWGTRWRSWMGHSATSRKFAGSIPRVGFTLSQATKALRESRGIALPYFRLLH